MRFITYAPDRISNFGSFDSMLACTTLLIHTHDFKEEYPVVSKGGNHSRPNFFCPLQAIIPMLRIT